MVAISTIRFVISQVRDQSRSSFERKDIRKFRCVGNISSGGISLV